MSLLIKNGTVVNPAKKQNEVADVLVKDGKIAAIGQNLSAEGAEVYDATGLIVAPGLIDIHTHLREPGQEAKEDFHSGTQAAAAGGFTRVVTMANTNPVVDNAALVRGLQKQAELTGVVKVEFIGAVSKGLEGKELAEMGDMAEAGVAAFSDDGHYVENAAFMRRALEYSSMFNKMVIDHAEDITLTKNGHMHEGIVSYELGVIGRPAVAEDLAVARDILLSEMTGGHIHIAHVSSKNTVDMVRRAKAKGLNVTCEVTPHHIGLTSDISNYRVNPPIREKEDVNAIIKGIKDGTVDCIGTDHAPHTEEDKKNGAPGMVGLETAFSICYTELVKNNGISINKLSELMSKNPANILKMNKGIISVGKDGDLVLVDLNKEITIDKEAFASKGKNTPFQGRKYFGEIVKTIKGGKVIYSK